MGADPEPVLARVPASFDGGDYGAERRAALYASMRASLVAAGLFADEAEAMLATWELSYFQSHGLRLFFVLPPAWVDHHLPVELSVPADLTRVMVGRIELVTARQRELLAAVAAGPTSDSRWFYEQFGPAGGGDSDEFWELWSKITSGRASLLDADLELPPDYRAYVELGRFRDALVLDELARRPTEGLRAFVGSYGIQP